MVTKIFINLRDTPQKTEKKGLSQFSQNPYFRFQKYFGL